MLFALILLWSLQTTNTSLPCCVAKSTVMVVETYILAGSWVTSPFLLKKTSMFIVLDHFGWFASPMFHGLNFCSTNILGGEVPCLGCTTVFPVAILHFQIQNAPADWIGLRTSQVFTVDLHLVPWGVLETSKCSKKNPTILWGYCGDSSWRKGK